MQWNTAISHIQRGKEIIRGYDLKELIQKKSFVDVVFLVLKGELPNRQEVRMMNALFTAAIDHGIGVSSAMTARTVVSTGNSMHTALAAGILSMGTLHGSAIEDAAHFFQAHVEENDVEGLVRTLREEHVRIPGYGHKILDHDPRSEALFEVARETEFYGKHCKFAEVLHRALNAVTPKRVPLNVDGAMAAIISDIGFDWRVAKGFFIIGRVPGLVAHIYEEMMSDNGLRRLREDEVEYTGQLERSL
ncbi:MAG: Citryl-CoA lyase [Parcubacteria group bacterium GW2011_GWA2_47_26]|nr:MAG: Citryl-CoA lyase [Parcubacteria group bacterium GW2011_GWA2_47_26]